MIQIKQSGKVFSNGIDHLRSEFSQESCVRLPQLIEPPLLSYLMQKVATARFVTKFEHDRGEPFGKILFAPSSEPALFALHFLLNNRDLFQVVQEITDCPPIGNFLGRIHSSICDGDHHIGWHGDNTDNRLLGLTIDLSSSAYEGGVFELRRKDSEELICSIPRQQPGDAFVFRISPQLQHRLTLIKGGGPRTVGVGWFRSQPLFSVFANEYFKFC